jgi:hypothetical protein
VDTHVGNTYTLEVDIDVTSNYTGNQWTDVVAAIELKDFLGGATFTNLSLLSAPGSVGDWALSADELNANGCAGGAHTGTNICSQAIGVTYVGAPVTGPGEILKWVFQFDTTGSFASTGHLKYLYEDSTGTNKVGDLGSWDIAIQNDICTYCRGTDPVPEPASLALFGSALACLAWVRHRRRRLTA